MQTNYKIIQIYYDDKTVKNCYDHSSVSKFYNPEHTDFFENSIIADLASEAADYDFFAVWSHLHKYKIQGQKLDFNRLENLMSQFDLIAFQRMMRNGRIFSGVQQKKYSKIFNEIMERLGLKYRFPNRPKFIVMQNHFITKSKIFIDYVEKVLRPAMEIMDQMPEAAERVEYRGKAKYYTFKPFLCEKLISAYIEERKFKMIHW
jgi:hypothetical protein